ncbi:MAG: CerR family C-terminal domain-containing protein [Candidatus Sumerlaeota bacterium]|nr:CerR family C-terminal domain-containing protein [Candidatus Sumerlaeota bacterium]
MKNHTESLETRQRLLEAAADVFSETGYRNATLREICHRANANIAAVNYHFRDKEQFYSAVIEHVIELEKDYVLSFGAQIDPQIPAKERLRAIIRSFLFSLLHPGRPNQLSKIWAWEMIEPTAGIDLLIEKVARHLQAMFRSIVTEILGAGADPRLINDCAGSILSQCTSYYHCRAVICKLSQYQCYDEATIEHLAEHVAQFSLGALEAMKNAG